MSKKTKILFTVSILLNVLLIGAHVGMMVKMRRDNPWHYAHENLSPETQNLVAREFQEARREMGDNMRAFHQARKDLTGILKKDKLDEDAYGEALKRMQDAQQKMTLRKIEMMKDLMAQLPPEEREKLSHRMMRPFGKHRGGKYGPQHRDVPSPASAE
jgi:uncharacterized membrane protein